MGICRPSPKFVRFISIVSSLVFHFHPHCFLFFKVRQLYTFISANFGEPGRFTMVGLWGNCLLKPAMSDYPPPGCFAIESQRVLHAPHLPVPNTILEAMQMRLPALPCGHLSRKYPDKQVARENW